MKLIHELYQPVIGILPIGDRFTMGGDQAAYACRNFFDFKTVIPCHYRLLQGLRRRMTPRSSSRPWARMPAR